MDRKYSVNNTTKTNSCSSFDSNDPHAGFTPSHSEDETLTQTQGPVDDVLDETQTQGPVDDVLDETQTQGDVDDFNGDSVETQTAPDGYLL
jgi:hypothetical protein